MYGFVKLIHVYQMYLSGHFLTWILIHFSLHKMQNALKKVFNIKSLIEILTISEI